MKNTGKQLERVVRLVEESYKDSANTQIFSNYKLPNKDGQEREIDLLIVSKINGFEICIAIECKDYNTRVSVDKIDSFQGKCSRLPQIHRKIFVSAKGYQKAAVTAANDFGIELLTAETLTAEYIKQLIPIRQIKPEFFYEVDNVVLNIGAKGKKLKAITESFNGEIFRIDHEKPEKILVLFADAMYKHRKEIFNLALIEYLRMKDTYDKDIITLWPPFGLKFEGYYTKHFEERIQIFNAQFNVKVIFRFVVPEQISGRSIKHSDGSIKADSLDIQIKDGLESHMVVRSDSEVDFFITENKQTRKLETLFTYDPKTDTFSKP